jgi:hypothetical protein
VRLAKIANMAHGGADEIDLGLKAVGKGAIELGKRRLKASVRERRRRIRSRLNPRERMGLSVKAVLQGILVARLSAALAFGGGTHIFMIELMFFLVKRDGEILSFEFLEKADAQHAKNAYYYLILRKPI